MSNFSVSPNPPRRLPGGFDSQRYALPPSSTVALGEGLLFGLPGGAVLAIPVALRASCGSKETFLVWLAATGLYGMVLAVLAACLRVARPLPRYTPALLLGVGFAFGPLALFGTLLAKHTHHRPLGAATYAVVAAGIVGIAWAFAARAYVSIHSPFKPRRQFGWATIVAGALASLATGALPLIAFLRQFNETPLISSLVFDGMLGMALAVVGGFAQFPSKVEENARNTGPVAFGACALVFALAMQSPLTGPALASASVLWAWFG